MAQCYKEDDSLYQCEDDLFVRNLKIIRHEEAHIYSQSSILIYKNDEL